MARLPSHRSFGRHGVLPVAAGVAHQQHLLLLNGAANGLNFVIPERLANLRLQPIIDTNAASPTGHPIAEFYPLASHCAVIIQVNRP
jgi:hypothetical protein